MKNHKLTMILGTIFGITLLPVAYLCLVVGIVLAFKNMGGFSVMFYIFAGLAIATIVCSLLAKKTILASRIALTTSTTALIATIIFLLAVGLDSIGIIAIFGAFTILGIIATIESYLAKSQKPEKVPSNK